MRGTEPSVPDGTVSAPAVAPSDAVVRRVSPIAAGPCATARADVDSRCAAADRLLAAAGAQTEALREARRRYAELARLRETDAEIRDRRHVADQKEAAQAEYNAAALRATDRVAVEEAAAVWLHRIDELNRRVRDAGRRTETLADRALELDRALPGLELAADAARIAAESAQTACLEARRVLTACEERASAPSDAAGQSASAWAPVEATGAAVSNPAGVAQAVRTLMRGDRQTLLGVALRLADETGNEAGRLQLLLLELRDAITARALDEGALTFPDDHPFWSQFPDGGAVNVVSSLAALGYRYDGGSGWVDGRAPQARELALALSYAGYDPRSLRRPAAQEAIDTLWQGTTVRGEDYLVAHAPDFELEQVVALLGPRASRLSELWDIWGRLRPLLMRPD